MGKPRDITWTWASKDNDLRTGYMAVDGRMTIPELIEHLAVVAPGIDLGDIHLNWATVSWQRPATGTELAKRAVANDRWQQRHDQWERDTYERLSKKFAAGGNQP